MGVLQVVVQLIPIAIAMAVSSVPIMATLIILLSKNRSRSSLPFLLGWVVGLAVVVTVCGIFALAIPAPISPRRPDTVAATIEIVIGVALAILAVVTWLRRDRDRSAEVPKWLASVGSLHPWAVCGLALLFNVRPKALLLAVAAGIVLRGGDLSAGAAAVAIVIYTVIAASTVAVPIIMTLASPTRMEPRLRSAQGWLGRNSASLTSAILLLVAVVVVVSGVVQLV